MTKKDNVTNLANVAAISAVDGKVTPEEGGAIQSIQKEIGAEETDLQRALTTVAKGNYNITPTGRFSERIQNLEDMVFVAISDGKFSKEEKPEKLELIFAKFSAESLA